MTLIEGVTEEMFNLYPDLPLIDTEVHLFNLNDGSYIKIEVVPEGELLKIFGHHSNTPDQVSYKSDPDPIWKEIHIKWVFREVYKKTYEERLLTCENI